MRKGFTIIELLVASVLLGLLVTILTMVFNQSSIAWRTGQAVTAGMDRVRDNIAEIREEADNAYIWNNEVHRVLGLWNEQGELRTRAWDVDAESQNDADRALFIRAKGGNLTDSSGLEDFKIIAVGSGDAGGALKTYTVNVKSAGPDKEFNTWDDIWSFPDEFE